MKLFNKKTFSIVFLAFAIIFTSCEINYSAIPTLGLESVEETAIWVFENIEKVPDSFEENGLDWWQSSEETYLRGAGDCEDIATIFMYLLKQELGIESEIVLASMPLEEDIYPHAFVSVDGAWWDPSVSKREVEKETYQKYWAKFTYRSYTWVMLRSL